MPTGTAEASVMDCVGGPLWDEGEEAHEAKKVIWGTLATMGSLRLQFLQYLAEQHGIGGGRIFVIGQRGWEHCETSRTGCAHYNET